MGLDPGNFRGTVREQVAGSVASHDGLALTPSQAARAGSPRASRCSAATRRTRQVALPAVRQFPREAVTALDRVVGGGMTVRHKDRILAVTAGRSTAGAARPHNSITPPINPFATASARLAAPSRANSASR